MFGCGHRDATVLDLPSDTVDLPFDADQIVEVAVDAGRSRQIAALDVPGRVTHARTLRPELVPSGAGQGAGPVRASWTTISRWIDVAVVSGAEDSVNICRHCRGGRTLAHQIIQRSLSSGSSSVAAIDAASVLVRVVVIHTWM